MNNKPRILIVENSNAFTGAFKSIMTSVEYLSDQFEFIVCIPSKSELESRIPKTLLTIPFLEIKKSVRALVLYFPYLLINSYRIYRFCKQNQIHIIHINDLYNMCGVVVKLFDPSIKIIYHVRLLPTSYARRLYPIWVKLITRYSDQIICVSNVVKRNFPDNKKVHVIYDSISQNDFATRLNFTSDKIKFLYVANYIRGKGHEYALEAFKRVQRVLEGSQLTFIGSDMGLNKNKQFKVDLIAYVLKNGLEDKVVFKDFVTQIEVEMRQSDIFLNLSESESFSMTCLEALYYGTPCIATDSGGPSEIIVSGDSGLIVPVGDSEAIIAAILKLALSLDLRKKFSINGQKRVSHMFSPDIQAKKLGSIYHI